VGARHAWVRVWMRQSAVERTTHSRLASHLDWQTYGLDGFPPSVHLLHAVEVREAGG